MLGIDKQAARVTWTVFLIVLLICLVYLAHEAILLFIAAFLLAYMLSPAVNLVCRVASPRLSRTTALAIVYVCLLLVVGVLGSWIGSQAVEQAGNLAARAPELIRRNSDLSRMHLPSWAEPARVRITAAITEQLNVGAERVLPLLQRAATHIGSVVGSLTFIILVPILTFLMLKDAVTLRESVLSIVPTERRPVMDDMFEDLNGMMAHYIRALVILSAVTSVAYMTLFELIGLPYGVLLALVAAPLEFIPFIGPLLGASIVVVVAMLTGFPHVWWVVLFFILYRLFQDYVLQPYLMSSGVELHPVVVIFGALAGEQLAGVWGMFLSVPVMASLRVMYVHLRRAQDRRRYLQ